MKTNSIFFSLLVCSVMIISCNNQPGKGSADKNETTVASTSTADTTKFTTDMVDNKKDPTCGMPLAAGIEDTAHYKNKVLGFCSKECKDEFLKDPEKNIAAADLKK
ncbi:MAG: YHS domain-containing protein [Ginsengibacter sp.]